VIETAWTIVSISGGALLLLLCLPTMALVVLGAVLMPMALAWMGMRVLFRALLALGRARLERN
jgi:hypothetical protein